MRSAVYPRILRHTRIKGKSAVYKSCGEDSFVNTLDSNGSGAFLIDRNREVLRLIERIRVAVGILSIIIDLINILGSISVIQEGYYVSREFFLFLLVFRSRGRRGGYQRLSRGFGDITRDKRRVRAYLSEGSILFL